MTLYLKWINIKPYEQTTLNNYIIICLTLLAIDWWTYMPPDGLKRVRTYLNYVELVIGIDKNKKYHFRKHEE